MASSQDDSEWDKSTSEIQSEESEDLFESRPNRWRGPPQSWRTLTEEDRLTFNALERVRNQDLSLHLYNAFALKTTPIPPEYQEVDATLRSEGSQLEPWAPPKSWTAWPLGADLVPADDLMKSTEDEDEALTFRRAESKVPSSQLEEVVSAVILRFAKERFRNRQLDEPLAPARGSNIVKSEPLSSGNESSSSQDSSGEKDKVMGKAVEKTYKPAVATDDDASYELIRPSTRAILSKLDQTLAILHHARNTSYRSLTDSASSSSDTEDDLYDEATPSGRRSRSRAKSRSRPTSRASSIASSFRARSHSLSHDAAASSSKLKSNRGRKVESVAREGESERDFLRRRAKEKKKRQPVFSDDETTTAAEGAKSPRKSRRTRKRTRAWSEENEYWSQKKMDRLNLRDWSDVMGAAALAGFDTKVIERATQRCANLFGQGMEMHTIDEDAGTDTKRYVPGRVILSSESEDQDEGEETDDYQKRFLSRHSSLAPSRAISLASSEGDERDEERRGVESPRKRQKRSSSRESALGVYYCHHVGCDRAIRSFDRPANLRRHLKLVHGEGDRLESHTPQPERREVYNCPHTDCERANRPFEKGHNLRRHLQLVHGEGSRGTSKGRAAEAQYCCPHKDCERATRRFDRVSNLRRHLKLVHGEDGPRTQRQGQQSEYGKESMNMSIPEKNRWESSSDEGGSQSEEDTSAESEDVSEGE